MAMDKVMKSVLSRLANAGMTSDEVQIRIMMGDSEKDDDKILLCSGWDVKKGIMLDGTYFKKMSLLMNASVGSKKLVGGFTGGRQFIKRHKFLRRVNFFLARYGVSYDMACLLRTDGTKIFV